MSTEKFLFTEEELGFLYSSVLFRIEECKRMIVSCKLFGGDDANATYWEVQLHKAEVLRDKLRRL